MATLGPFEMVTAVECAGVEDYIITWSGNSGGLEKLFLFIAGDQTTKYASSVAHVYVGGVEVWSGTTVFNSYNAYGYFACGSTRFSATGRTTEEFNNTATARACLSRVVIKSAGGATLFDVELSDPCFAAFGATCETEVSTARTWAYP